MYKALNYWVFGGFDAQKTPEEFIDFAAAQGLDGVELTFGDVLPRGVDGADCDRIRAYAARKNIGLRTLATGCYWNCSLGSADAAQRRAAVAFTREYLRTAARLGAETVLVVPGATRVAWDASVPVTGYREVWENSTAALREILPEAEDLGVNIALENVWGRFLLSPMEWKFYLEQFSSPRLGMYFDAGNCCLNGRPEDYPPLLGKKIFALHLKNFRGADCGGGLSGFGEDLLAGEVDFAALFAALARAGYDGPYTVEMVPFCRLPDLRLPDAALAADCADKLRRLESEYGRR